MSSSLSIYDGGHLEISQLPISIVEMEGADINQDLMDYLSDYLDDLLTYRTLCDDIAQFGYESDRQRSENIKKRKLESKDELLSFWQQLNPNITLEDWLAPIASKLISIYSDRRRLRYQPVSTAATTTKKRAKTPPKYGCGDMVNTRYGEIQIVQRVVTSMFTYHYVAAFPHEDDCRYLRVDDIIH